MNITPLMQSGAFTQYSEQAKATVISNMQGNRAMEDFMQQSQQQAIQATSNFYNVDTNKARAQEIMGNLGQNINVYA
jgi:hypothetical protein